MRLFIFLAMSLVGLWSVQANIVIEPFGALKAGVNCDRVRDSEFLCLACNIYHESGNQSMTGKRAVAAVTLNRTKNKFFPHSICGVVWDKGEFSWTRDHKTDLTLNSKWWLQSLSVANEAMVDSHQGKFADPTQCALFYHGTYISKPYWVASENLKTTKVIEQHVFYRSPKMGCAL